ncbi:MAG: type I restriction enzyme HsdR N-terminal domain-containing protein [Bryobacteraceae bacterium]|jgi:predicted type IV restriction endonuclease
MALENTLADITARLRQGRFPNEQAISQGIVLRLLQELGWDTWDTAVVWPEYQTGEGRVDFALCHPASKPAIFIEVKQPGKAEDGVRQALEYAFHTGVPFIVLTDGKTWSFYLPAEQGSYEDRRVYKLDLFERLPGESIETLSRYLARARIESGEALETARKEYRSRNRRSQARAAIPEAWRELVEKGNEDLVELLAGAVELKAGVRPENDDVAEFLATLSKNVEALRSNVHVQAGLAEQSQAPQRAPGETSRSGRLVLRGQPYTYTNAKEAMVIVLSELAKGDPSFLERCSHHPDAQGRKRRYIARTPEELYPDREDLRDMREPLPGGWLVATNLNNVLKKTIIKLAAGVAGLTFGKDVIVEF